MSVALERRRRPQALRPRRATGCSVVPSPASRRDRLGRPPGGRGKRAVARFVVGLTAKALSCAAKAHVPKPRRRAACPHLKAAIQTAYRADAGAVLGGSA